MTIMEITPQINQHAAMEFREVLAQLLTNIHHLDSQRVNAIMQGNLRASAELALMQLQCTLATTVISFRAAAYERCRNDEPFAKQFWSKLPCN